MAETMTTAILPGRNFGPDGRRFPWGPITQTHRIADYFIVEYREDRSNFRDTQPELHMRTMFHPFIGGKDTSRSYESLDSALVGVVGYRREGPNGRAADYFDRMTLTES